MTGARTLSYERDERRPGWPWAALPMRARGGPSAHTPDATTSNDVVLDP